jgi:hypothetical protein
MGLRQREWARKTRDKLRLELGGVCSVPGCGRTDDLEFDVILPVDQPHHRIEWSQRMSFYRQQHARKNLCLKCSYHNGLKRDDLELNVDLLDTPQPSP